MGWRGRRAPNGSAALSARGAIAQLTHALGLNDVCDSLRLHSGPLSAVRGATPPSRNNLSHANKQRPAALSEKLFWAVLAHLQNLSPAFAAGGRGGRRLAHRFKAAIHVVDATTIEHLFALQERGEARGEDEHLRFHGGRDRAITTRVCHVRVSSLGKNLMQDLD